VFAWLADVLVRVVQRKKTVSTYRQRTIYLEELAFVIRDASKSKICMVSQQAGDPGKT
jgi:hypothetical protein